MRRTTSSSARATRSTSGSSRDSCRRSTTTGTSTRTSTPGCIASAARRSRPRHDLVDGKCPEHDREPEWIEERNWFFRLSSFQEQLLELYERADFVLPGIPRERGAQLHRGRPPGLLDQPRRPDVGDPDPVGSGFGRLRLGGCPRQLPQRADLRAPRRGPGRRRSGRRSGTCSRRTSCASTASTGPRCCSPPDTSRRGSSSSTGTCCSTTGRSRSRSGTSSTRSICSTSTASIRSGSGARGQSRSARTARPRSKGIHERYERELGNDLGNLLSRTTAMVARYRDGTLRALPSPDGAVAAALAPLACRRRGAARRLRHHGSAGANLGGRARAQPRGRDDGALAAGEGRRARRRPRPGALRPRRRPPCRCVALSAYVPETAAAILRRCSSRPRSTGRSSPTASPPRRRGSRPRRRSSRASSCPRRSRPDRA